MAKTKKEYRTGSQTSDPKESTGKSRKRCYASTEGESLESGGYICLVGTKSCELVVTK